MSGTAPSLTTQQFEGFPEGGYEFFLELQVNQSRPWFLAHKLEYERLWEQPMRSLAAALAAELAATYPRIGETRPHVFRIQRDTRFSADKSPYKTHVALALSIRPPVGRAADQDSGVPALYLHFGLDEDIVGAGRWQLGKEDLARFRAAVDHPTLGARLQALMAKLESVGFERSSRDLLKRVPAPFAQDHPRGELLKLKGLAVSRLDIPEGLMSGRGLLGWLTEQYRRAAPIIEWIDDALARPAAA